MLKIDWHDEGKEGRRGGEGRGALLLCNDLIVRESNKRVIRKLSENYQTFFQRVNDMHSEDYL